tara:strand:+ start:147 stop:311 length:165 start_codon:yes stop_codon:yes gene_type:complete
LYRKDVDNEKVRRKQQATATSFIALGMLPTTFQIIFQLEKAVSSLRKYVDITTE